MESWQKGDRCRLVVLKSGRVYDGEIVDVHKNIARVAAGGRLWRVKTDSGFLLKPETAP